MHRQLCGVTARMGSASAPFPPRFFAGSYRRALQRSAQTSFFRRTDPGERSQAARAVSSVELLRAPAASRQLLAAAPRPVPGFPCSAPLGAAYEVAEEPCGGGRVSLRSQTRSSPGRSGAEALPRGAVPPVPART